MSETGNQSKQKFDSPYNIGPEDYNKSFFNGNKSSLNWKKVFKIIIGWILVLLGFFLIMLWSR